MVRLAAELSLYDLPTEVIKSALSPRVTGAEERKYMSKKIKYTDEPIGKNKIKKDFLPKPEELVLKENTVKVTLLLTKESLEYFKKEAKMHHTQYQKMIRVLVDKYAAHYSHRE